MTNNQPAAVSAVTSADDVELPTDRHNRRFRELHAAQKAVLFDALAAASITHVIVKFDGYGDEGQIEDVAARIADAGVICRRSNSLSNARSPCIVRRRVFTHPGPKADR